MSGSTSEGDERGREETGVALKVWPAGLGLFEANARGITVRYHEFRVRYHIHETNLALLHSGQLCTCSIEPSMLLVPSHPAFLSHSNLRRRKRSALRADEGSLLSYPSFIHTNNCSSTRAIKIMNAHSVSKNVEAYVYGRVDRSRV